MAVTQSRPEKYELVFHLKSSPPGDIEFSAESNTIRNHTFSAPSSSFWLNLKPTKCLIYIANMLTIIWYSSHVSFTQNLTLAAQNFACLFGFSYWPLVTGFFCRQMIAQDVIDSPSVWLLQLNCLLICNTGVFFKNPCTWPAPNKP